MPGATIPAVPPQFLLNDGTVAASALLFTYESGTTTKLATYTNQALTSANTNPIVLDSAGRATIFLKENDAYKFVLAPSTDSDPPIAPIWTRDGITSIPNSGNTDIVGTHNGLATAGQVVYLDSSGQWNQAINDVVASAYQAYAIGITTEVTDASFQGSVRVAGRVTGLTGLNPGDTYYVASVAGTLTGTKPTNGGSARVVGVADSATSLILTPSIPFDDVYLNMKSVGFSVGQGNGATTTDTLLSSYSLTIQGGVLSEGGHAIIIDGTFSLSASARAKEAKVKVGAGTTITLFSTAANVAGHVVPFRAVLRYRTETTGSLTSIAFIDAASAGAPTNYLVNGSLGNIDWTADQVLAIYADTDTAGFADDILLTDYNVSLWQGPGGVV